MLKKYFIVITFCLFSFNFFLFASDSNRTVAYIVSDIEIPFWATLSKGIKNSGLELGYKSVIYDSDNSKKVELENIAKAIKERVDGIILSPIDSSTCVTLLNLAKMANIPVVIADIGTERGEYLSFISSDNESGAYYLGEMLVKEMKKRGFEDGRVGIVAIPQKRKNGQLRTKGFMRALGESNIKTANIKQQVNFTYEETYNYSLEFINDYKDLKALFLEGAYRYKGALDAIKKADKEDEVLLITFDADPIFLDLISNGTLIGAGMQQPFLIGEMALKTLDRHFRGEKVEKDMKVEVLIISKENIDSNLKIIYRNVLGIE